MAPEGSSEPDNRTELAHKCVPKEHWCPGANVCVPFDASCNPHVCINGSMSGLRLPRANYSLWKEFLFSVPAGPPTQYLVCVLVWACMSLTAQDPGLSSCRLLVCVQQPCLNALAYILLQSPCLISFSGSLSLCYLRGNSCSPLEAATCFYLSIPEKVLFTCGSPSCYIFLVHVPCVNNVLFV